MAYASAASMYASIGRADSAGEMLRRLEGLGRRRHVPAAYIAVARLAAGDRPGALDALEEALRNHDLGLLFALGIGLEALDGEPRYEAVRKRVFGNRPAPRSAVGRMRGAPPPASQSPS